NRSELVHHSPVADPDAVQLVEAMGPIERLAHGCAEALRGIMTAEQLSGCRSQHPDLRLSGHPISLRVAADPTSLFVIEGQAKEIAEGRKRSFHCISFGFLKRLLMSFAQCDAGAMPNPAAISADDSVAGADVDAHPRGIGARLGVTPRILP